MKFEQLKLKFEEKFKKFSPLIVETANQIFNREFKVEISSLNEITGKYKIEDEFPLVFIRSSIIEENESNHLLLLTSDFALKLYAWMIGGEPDSILTDEHLEGLRESANQIFGQIQTMSANNGENFQVSELNIVVVNSQEELEPYLLDEEGILGSYNIKANDESFNVRHYIWPSVVEKDMKGDNIGSKEKGSDNGVIDVNPAEFGEFGAEENYEEIPQNLDMLLDVELEIFVELGRKKMLIGDVLKLGKGSIVELDKAAGEPLEIFVNGRKFAEGEVVVVDDHFGIRVTQLVVPKERIKNLS